MRRLTLVTLMLFAVPALAQKEDKHEAAVAAVKAVLDKADVALNAGDAKSLSALFDKTFFYAGAHVSDKDATAEAAKEGVEKEFASGPVGKFTRGDTIIHADDDGDTAWYLAEYDFLARVAPGQYPVRRKIRESGVLVRRGKDWKFAMVHQSQVQPDPVKPAHATPPPAPSGAK